MGRTNATRKTIYFCDWVATLPSSESGPNSEDDHGPPGSNFDKLGCGCLRYLRLTLEIKALWTPLTATCKRCQVVQLFWLRFDEVIYLVILLMIQKSGEKTTERMVLKPSKQWDQLLILLVSQISEPSTVLHII